MELVDGLPSGVAKIAEHLARMAKGYDNHLKWNEQAMFKADLMNVKQRWLPVDVAAFAAKLRKEGMREQDSSELVDWLRKAKAGRQLIPQRSYRNFKFEIPVESIPARPDDIRPW